MMICKFYGCVGGPMMPLTKGSLVVLVGFLVKREALIEQTLRCFHISKRVVESPGTVIVSSNVTEENERDLHE
jgi:hypothetical protein